MVLILFLAKSPSKVNRFAFLCQQRYVANNIVAAKFADRYKIQIYYAIGIAKLTCMMIETFDTEK